MADCKRCGRPAGLFRSFHKGCTAAAKAQEAEKRQQAEETDWNSYYLELGAAGADGETEERGHGDERRAAEPALQSAEEGKETKARQELRVLAQRAVWDASACDRLATRMHEIETALILWPDQPKSVLIDVCKRALSAALESASFSHEQEQAFGNFRSRFSIEQDEINDSGLMERVVKYLALRDLSEGKVPERVALLGGSLPFNQQADERAVWYFSGVDYLEEKPERSRAGTVSWSVQKMDRGALTVTTKQIVFSGQHRCFGITYKKILSFRQYPNGVGLHRGSATGKQQLFVTGDGSFTYNLLVEMARLSQQAGRQRAGITLTNTAS